MVRTGRPDIRLTVVGGAGFAPNAPLTPYEKSLRRVAAPAEDRIRFVPFTARADVPRRLGAADVTVVPSTWPDPCPLTVLEGAASGAAVVASRIGGIPEIAGPAPGATLVRPGDVDELAGVLRGFAESPAALSRAQAAAAAYAQSHEASWDLALATLQGALDG
ncbi:hypothetical protein GCM10025864_26520 [Luteimicrobium album]|uniref:Glycosyltransferase n=1 Tax=Luteimicrobium album TaxID=1054550 RepID=A0ABQ6I4J4_9MICO|nr:glycosyltransferase [Luteimicrobium album]GMA24893.1 hypothetical protein GCM10025864_26520 [Luteimicrobium album]